MVPNTRTTGKLISRWVIKIAPQAKLSKLTR